MSLQALKKKVKDTVPKENNLIVEYENVTDTIKRRLESPVNTPETEKVESVLEVKKSKIPLALKSPIPIRREIVEGGNRSRTPSLERTRKRTPDRVMSESITNDQSNYSVQPSTSHSSIESTPETPKKESSTFNLLKDSELFTQISKNKYKSSKHDPCHVVAVTEHEILKSRVSPIEPMEIYPSDAVETVMQFIPHTVETVEILDDTETESVGESEEEKDIDKIEKRASVDLGKDPMTFVVEVKKVEERMNPTLGVLKRKTSSAEDKPKIMKLNIDNVPDLIPSTVIISTDESMKTPPSTPYLDGEQIDCPLLYDLAVRQQEAKRSLRDEDVNEYLILDDVPKDQANLPEQSLTEEVFANDPKLIELRKQQIFDASKKPVKKTEIEIVGTTDKIRKMFDSVNEEDIYSEVDEIPLQV